MIKFITGFLILYIAFCGFIYYTQKSLLFFPDKTPFRDCYFTNRKDVEIHHDEKKRVRFYFIETDHPKPRGQIVHFHGNGGRACDRFPIVERFLDMGFHLVLAEYPGYAEEAPVPSQEKMLESAVAVVDEVRKKNDDLPIVLYGESIGGAFATYLAAEVSNIHGLILQTPLPSATKLGRHHYPFLPIKLLLSYPLPAHKWAPKTNVPVFMFHGTEDKIIPISYTREFFEDFPTSHKKFVEVPGAGHNDLMIKIENSFNKKLNEFLNSL